MLVEPIIQHDPATLAEHKGLYERCLRNWGMRDQQDMCQEECGELIVALNHERRHRVLNDKVLKEIVDVLFMCDQMISAYGFTKDELAYRLRHKIMKVAAMNTEWEKHAAQIAAREAKGCEE
jgi:NTP pyrophosphatase (non-canonical NTP hydrolase)